VRVLLTTDVFLPRVSGLVSAVTSLASALRDDGHGVVVVCPATAAATAWAKSTGIDLIPVQSLRWMGGVGLGVWRGELPACDIVHAHSPALIGGSVAKHARAKGIPVVATLHTLPGNLVGMLPVPLERHRGTRRALVWALRAQLRSATVVVAPSGYGARLLRSRLDGRSVHVVPNGISIVRPGTRRPAPDPVRPRLLYVGRLQREKRVSELLAATRLCQEAGVKAELTIVGEGHQRRRLERSAGPGVTFTGEVSGTTLAEARQRADVFCMPSREELQGLAVLEAMADGLPAVAARAGALPETIGRGGRLFTPGDPADFARQILSVVSSPDRYTACSVSAQCHAQRYAMDAVLPRLSHIYHQVLSR
jgi:glycosyltransferase involved in cell wall biosynthesis